MNLHATLRFTRVPMMRKPRSLPRQVLVASLFLSSAAVHAQVSTPNIVRLDLEGLTVLSGGIREDVAVSDFYNGGSSKVPGSTAPVVSGPSPRLGVVFSSNALAAETSQGGRGGQHAVFGQARDLTLEDGSVLAASTALGFGALVSGGMDYISLAYEFGFDNGLSFFFNSDTDLRVSVFSNTGSLLASEDLRLSGSGGSCSAGAAGTRCSWVAASVPFLGTAYGVVISGLSGDFALDNITLGMLDPLGAIPTPSTPPGPVTPVVPPVVPVTPPPTPITPIPEPGTYGMMALGVAGVWWAARRRRAQPAARAAA